MKILSNKIKCKMCGDIIESANRHDFKWCNCKSCYVDGGLSYLKRGFKGATMEESIEELSDYELDCEECIYSDYKRLGESVKLKLYCMLWEKECPDSRDKDCFIER